MPIGIGYRIGFALWRSTTLLVWASKAVPSTLIGWHHSLQT